MNRLPVNTLSPGAPTPVSFDIGMDGVYERLRLTLAAIGDGVIATDTGSRVTYLNPAAERLLGWSLDEAEGMSLADVFHLVHEETGAPAEIPVPRCLRENRVVRLADHSVLVARDGSEIGIEDSTAPIRDPDGNVVGAVLVFRDVTEQRRLAGEISYLASHDPLTGLLNRTLFEKRLQTAVESAQHIWAEHVLCYLDLDQFKLINDVCGHAAGDLLLQRVAGVLMRCVRSRDAVARVGGDEFALLLEHCELDQAKRVAQKICDRVEHMHFIHGDRNFGISASIGLVPITRRWATMDAALQAADIACYAAKEAGRNRIHVYADYDRRTQDQRSLVDWGTRIEQAIRQDQFLLYGQRIHSLQGDGSKPHCEVLLRLQGQGGTVISPGAFLPAAERFNIAARIDQWTLRNVLGLLKKENHRWNHIDRIAINLSGQSLSDPNFQQNAVQLLLASGIDLNKLCFEITETAAISRMEDAAAFIRDLRSHGVGFALDDFGNGFSSFGYLKSLPIDYLKIDGRFVQNILSDPIDHTTIKCFAEVARVAGKQVIAECVENAAVGTALMELGIDYAQGYWKHRPEPLARALGLAE